MKSHKIRNLLISSCFTVSGFCGQLSASSYDLGEEMNASEYHSWYSDITEDYYEAFPEGWASEQKLLETIDVNLIWLSTKIKAGQDYVFPSVRENLAVAPYIKDWVEKGYKLTFWYDSKNSTNEQVLATKKLFLEIAESLGKEPSRLKLVDIWTVPSVQQQRAFFENKSGSVPIYFRADMIRLMISSQQISSQGSSAYSVYADMDVKAVPVSELLSKDQQELMNEIGMVAARGGVKLGMENAFHVVARQKEVKEAIDFTVEANFARFNVKDSGAQSGSGQQVYDTYEPMFQYIYHKKGLGTLTTDNNELFDLAKHKKKALKLFCTRSGAQDQMYYNQFARHFSWNQKALSKLSSMMRKDTYQNKLEDLRESQKDLNKLEAEVGDYETILALVEDLKATKKSLETIIDKYDNMDSKDFTDEMSTDYDTKEDEIYKLGKRISKLTGRYGPLRKLQSLARSIENTKEKMRNLKNPNVGFNIPPSWISKVTVIRPSSKGQGYN